MNRILKLLIASALTVSMCIATVLCCCIAPEVMAHFHKKVTCGHCADERSHSNPANPAGACQQQLSSTDFLQDQISFSPAVSGHHVVIADFLVNHRVSLTSFLLSAHPPGGPPLGSLAPLYLRTFNLRI